MTSGIEWARGRGEQNTTFWLMLIESLLDTLHVHKNTTLKALSQK